jgi:hypothetical protein
MTTERSHPHQDIIWNNTCDGFVLLGDGVDGVEDAREVPQEGEQEAYPELMLQEKRTRNQ